MSEKEKEVLTRLSETLPLLDESKKEYLLGYADGIAAAKKKEEAKKEDKEV